MQQNSKRMRFDLQNKKIAIALILMMMMIVLTGCGNKAEIAMSFQDFSDYEVTEIPQGLENCFKGEEVLTVTVKKNGEYPFIIRDDTGIEHSFTLIYKNKTAEVQSEENLSINLSIK